MKITLVIFTLFAALVSACTTYSAEYNKSQQENDSLRLLLTKNEVEMNDMLEALNGIEEDINTIREAENFIKVEKDAELSDSRRVQLQKNMDLIVETLNRNKQQLAELQEKVNSGNIRVAALQKTIDRLTKDLGEKSALVVQLQNSLAHKDEQIKELSGKVENLNQDIKKLEEVSETKTERISKQDKELNNVYYCFGTKKELKEQHILSGGGLFSKSKALIDSDFNKEYFQTIDKRRVLEIALYASKAEVMTNHPRDSYTFFKDKDGNITLEIKDPEKFWSLSKYLVIVVG
jgi:DNA repair exonuclease SbcCD ATPase subunit